MTRVTRYLLMELGHADVCGRYEDLSDALADLHRIAPFADDEDEYGVVEVDDEGRPVGEPIVASKLRADDVCPKGCECRWECDQSCNEAASACPEAEWAEEIAARWHRIAEHYRAQSRH